MLIKIISGGQTGADEAGLQAAYDLGFKTGGTAPLGYKIQNFEGFNECNLELKTKFGLTEHSSSTYPPRTKKNVRDSNGTVLFGYIESSGAKLTIKTCNQLNKPLIINPSSLELFDWIKQNKIEILNCAGNRLSEYNPSIYNDTYEIVYKTLKVLKGEYKLFMSWNYRILSTGEIIECYYDLEGKAKAYTDKPFFYLNNKEDFSFDFDENSDQEFEDYIISTYKNTIKYIQQALDYPILDIKEFDLPVENRTVWIKPKNSY